MRRSPSILVDATGATERRGGCKEMKQERSRVVLRIEEDGKKEVQKEANNWPYKKERKQANGHILACGIQTAVSRV